MPCACQGKKPNAQKYTVVKANGDNYRVYNSKIEAEAAAKRINGRVK